MEKNPDPSSGEQTWMTTTFRMDVGEFCRRSKGAIGRQVGYICFTALYCLALSVFSARYFGMVAGLIPALAVTAFFGSVIYRNGVSGKNNMKFDPVPFQVLRRIEFREAGFFYREERGHFAYYPYKGIHQIKEIERHLFFYLSKMQAISIPSSTFPNEGDYENLVDYFESQELLK